MPDVGAPDFNWVQYNPQFPLCAALFGTLQSCLARVRRRGRSGAPINGTIDSIMNKIETHKGESGGLEAGLRGGSFRLGDLEPRHFQRLGIVGCHHRRSQFFIEAGPDLGQFDG